jgi:hypothetical protein
MGKGFLGSLAAMLGATAVAMAQSSAPPAPPTVADWLGLGDSMPPPAVQTAEASYKVEPCGPPGRVWVNAEYLLWWIKPSSPPPLVTTGPESSRGILGQPGTQVLLDGSDLHRDSLNGGRFSAGAWYSDSQTIGGEFEYFFLAPRSSQSSFASSGLPVLARPFFNLVTNREDSALVAFPGMADGRITVSSRVELQGASARLLWNLLYRKPENCMTPFGYRIDLFAGPRYADLQENISTNESVTVPTFAEAVIRPTSGMIQPFQTGSVQTLGSLPGAPPGDPQMRVLSTPLMGPPVGSTIGGTVVAPRNLGPTQIALQERFETENQFFGGVIGSRAEVWLNRIVVDLNGGVGLGTSHEDVRITGSSVFVPPTDHTASRNGGLLALPTNVGWRSRDQFAVLPEGEINIGYQANTYLRIYVGYGFIYWSRVIRPGDAIDPVINVTQLATAKSQPMLTGPARPTLSFKDSDFWAHGLSVGLQFRY